MRLQGATRTDPRSRDYRTWLLPRVSSGKANVGPGVKDARFGEPIVSEFIDPLPHEAVLLTAAPECAQP